MSASSRLSWSTAFKIALREARPSAAKFAFVVLAVGVGVGVLTGVRGFSEAFRGMLLREARTLMAADLMVRSFDDADPEQRAAVERLRDRGVGLTRITETISMLSSDNEPTPVLVSVKAVDPTVYPYYGEVKLEPPGQLRERLNAETVGVSEDLLPRLNIGIGDFVRLGEARFRIAAVVRLEPDRMTGSLNVGPRIMVTREGLERAALMQVGSRASHRFLFRLQPNGPSVEEVRQELEKTFRSTLVTDFREVHPRIRRGLDRSTTFLSLVSLIAMIIGGLGVGMAIHSHLQQRLDTIAIMKCLGARSTRIMRIYVVQTTLLGLAGGLLGVLLGVAIQAVFPVLIERYFQLRPERVYDLSVSVQGLAIGLLVTLLFTLPPLLGIREVRPAAIFRREMTEAKRPLRERIGQARRSAGMAAILLIALGLLAAWLVGGDWDDALETSGIFLGTLIVSLLVLSAVAWCLMRGLRVFVRRTSSRLPALLRHGVANLYRPGNHAQGVLVALGVGVMFIQTVYLIQHGLLIEMVQNAPKDMPNVFLINITEGERAGVMEVLKSQEGRESDPEIFASARARIASINGTPMDQVPLEGWAARRYRRERTVTWLDEKPENVNVIAGAWWDGSKGTSGEPLLCIADDIADTLELRPGAQMEWTAGGVALSARVQCVHRVEEAEFGPSLDFVFNTGALKGMPVTYFGGVRMRAASVSALQRAVYREFPTVTVINVAEVLAIAQEVLDQVAIVVRFVAAFAILAGLIILASSVAGTRFRRIREAAILKTLGATRRRVITVFSIEFLILGSAAGFMGVLLASGFSRFLLARMLDASFRFEPLPNLAAIALTAVVATAAGWLASYRILGQKPLEVLRQE